MQIHLEKTLDVNVVEDQFAELWKKTAGEGESEDDEAVLRARVANLLIYVPTEALLKEVDKLVPELTAVHPSRVVVMLGERDATDQDIEMYVESYCETDKRTGAKRLCCEQVTLKARGQFVVELPSAALPLLVSDLSTFVWWQDALDISESVFRNLLAGSDRLVIDSAEFEDPHRELLQVHKLFQQPNQRLGISDLNWARLTFWRGLLADFYDVPAYRAALDEIEKVQIDYVSPGKAPGTVAPQAMLFMGWLASRLGWTFVRANEEANEVIEFEFSRSGPEQPLIKLKLNRVETGTRKPGRLVQVQLHSTSDHAAMFRVARSADNVHLYTEAQLGTAVNPGRVLPVRNRSAARLLAREMEILCNDQIYQEAAAIAARVFGT
ncbi:MAG: glucose-6-phosphate dehydrogenase assembly protein OpcA [Acidobacteriota bacterium]|nr:glucose-6-phosphate dehydrogenase assembly protein OpcA [Acidobacteriota bacterium]